MRAGPKRSSTGVRRPRRSTSSRHRLRDRRIGRATTIVLTIMEHHSNIVPWHFHRERKGAVLKWIDVRDDGSLDMDAFEAAIGPKTKMVAVTHMSNVLGTVNPIARIIEIAHAKGRAGADRRVAGRGARECRRAGAGRRFPTSLPATSFTVPTGIVRACAANTICSPRCSPTRAAAR